MRGSAECRTAGGEVPVVVCPVANLLDRQWQGGIFRGSGELFIPGWGISRVRADALARIAAENAVADFILHLTRNFPAIFDCVIADAAIAVDGFIGQDRAGGAGGDAGGAVPTAIRSRFCGVGLQRKVAHDFREVNVIPKPGDDEHAVSSDPTEAGLYGKRSFGKWGGIYKASADEAGEDFADAVAKFDGTLFQQLVIIAAASVSRDVRRAGRFVGFVIVSHVADGEADYAAGAFDEFIWMQTFVDVVGHEGHAGVKSVG